jgi:chromosome condensin MukBEF MukE localization factor
MRRWLRRLYDRMVTDLATRIADKLMGAVDDAVRRPAEGDVIRAQTWYPVVAKAVLVTSASKKSGEDKREAVLETMREWFAVRNLVCPSRRVLHLAIETALSDPVRKG